MNETQKDNSQRLPRERSAAYPAISLEEAAAYSAKLQTAFSKAAFSRENAVKEMGHQTVTGISGMKVAALVHYGLLERDGNAYRNSQISLRLAHRIDDDDFNDALKIAATTPKLYKALLSEFSGRAIPTALSSILVRNHKIGQKVANDVANTFRKTIEYAGLYQNGIVSSELPMADEESGTTDTELPKSTITAAHRPAQTPARPVPGNQSQMLSVELPSGVILSYPKLLGYAFTIGKFGAQIAALEEAVQKEIAAQASSDTKDA